MMRTSASAKFDGLGIFWMTFAGVWTILLVAGMTFLYTRRDMPILRIRGLSLSFGAVVLLHLYWVAVQFGYIYGHLMPNAIEFWIMGIYLPFGVALFHASNSRFLHVAKMQKKYAQQGGIDFARPRARTVEVGPWARLRKLDYTTKMLTVVCVGMAIQFVLTLVMFMVSRKFHPSFGLPGTELSGTHDEQQRDGQRGWEWWPSVFWQIFWAWIVAPYILWQSRNIHDTQGWRLQTIACSLASLHAAPMWIVALNLDAMSVVNEYFIPPQWIAISIMFLEIFTIFLPCWQVLRHQSLRSETLELIALWETGKNKKSGSGKSFASGSTGSSGSTRVGIENFVSWRQMGDMEKGASFDAAVAGGLLTMDALEYALKKNPDPLQHFSALKDFSGENIAFLTSVSQWKRAFRPVQMRAQLSGSPTTRSSSFSIAKVAVQQTQVQEDTEESAADRLREQFNQALRIYTEFISQSDAEFSINISSSDLRKIECVFEDAARATYGDRQPVSSATPFDTWATELPPLQKKPSSISGSSERAIMTSSAGETRSRDGGEAHDMDGGSTIGDKMYYWGPIPEAFDETVFDDAETSIKYLVLTNTWPKFVKHRRTSIDSAESNDSYDTLIDMVVRRTQGGDARRE